MTPRQRRTVAAVACVAVAVLVQVVVLSRLPFPAPSLVLAVVVAVGMASGSTTGAIAGFGAGLALDVLPPAPGVLGVTALALVVVGDLSGRVRDPRGLAPAQRLGVVAALAALAWLVQVTLSLLLGVPAPAPGALLASLFATTVGTALVGALVVPFVAALLRLAGGARRLRRPRPIGAAG